MISLSVNMATIYSPIRTDSLVKQFVIKNKRHNGYTVT